jgi:hypothetical protein
VTIDVRKYLIANPSARTKRYLTAAIVIVFNLCIYSLPTLMTATALRSRGVPVISGPDLSLYLNLSNVGPSREHLDLNPYYGTVTQPGSIGYRTFDLAFRMFNVAAKIARYDLWSALLAWNLFWWSAIALGAIWFWELTLLTEDLPVQWLGLSLLLLFNFGVVRPLLLAWLHLPSLNGFAGLNLPYSRSFFSQVPIALLLFYLVLQVRALRFGKWHSWAGMCLLQIAAFWTFPYATLLMALTTLVATLAWCTSGPFAARLRVVILFGAACGAFDALFLFLRPSAASLHAHSAFLLFRPWLVPTLARGAASLVIALTLLTAAIPPVGSREVKWIIGGLGLGNALLLFGDVFFAPELLVSHHGGYFLHCTVSLEIAYLVAALFAAFGDKRGWFRVVSFAAIALITINGAILAFASGRYLLPLNQRLAGFARALGSANLNDGDLVVASAETVEDLCAWVPLLSRGRVLFCRPAQYELSGDEKRGLYRSRQAFYLYFQGKGTNWVEQVISVPHAAEEGTLLFADETTSSDHGYRDKGRLAIRNDLVPKLLLVEHADSEMRTFFHPYHRVLVVDDAGHPAFVRGRLESYFSIYAEDRVDNFALLWCTPK